MRHVSRLVTLALLVVGFAGCVEEEAATSQDADAPLGPKQLRVGQTTLDEYIRFAVNSSGHRIRYDFRDGESSQSVEPFEDRNYVERRIALEKGRDRYWQEFDGVQYQMRLTDVDPEEGELAITNVQSTYRLADRMQQYNDFQTTYQSRSFDCTLMDCESKLTTEEINFRYYPTEGQPFEVLSVAGKVLTLGRTTTVNHTWTDEQGNIWGEWVNYTAKKETQINGQRVFLVDIKSERRLMNEKPTEDASVQTEASNGILPTITQKKLPKPVREIYIGERFTMPVKQVYKTPFEYEGRVYWYNSTYEVETYEAGAGTIPWGNEPRINNSKAGTLPAEEMVASLHMPALKYPFQTAWKNLRADATMVDFNEIAAKEGSFPTSSVYFPDAGHDAFTWAISVSDADGSQAEARTRMQGVGSSGLYAVQDREDNSRRGGFRPLTAEDAKGMTFTKGEDIFATFRAARPGTWEPAIMLSLGQHEQDFVEAEVVFADPSSARPVFTNTGPFGYELVRVRDTISFSLFDGGIRMINGTWFHHVNDWPMRPPFGTPVPPGQASEDMRVMALLERPWDPLGPSNA